MLINRRRFLFGVSAAVIVTPGLLMPIKAPLVTSSKLNPEVQFPYICPPGIVYDERTGVTFQHIVAGEPQAGQYRFDMRSGTYTFAKADDGRRLRIVSQYGQAPGLVEEITYCGKIGSLG